MKEKIVAPFSQRSTGSTARTQFLSTGFGIWGYVNQTWANISSDDKVSDMYTFVDS